MQAISHCARGIGDAAGARRGLRQRQNTTEHFSQVKRRRDGGGIWSELARGPQGLGSEALGKAVPVSPGAVHVQVAEPDKPEAELHLCPVVVLS